jgi:HK97 family phage major capsid protein
MTTKRNWALLAVAAALIVGVTLLAGLDATHTASAHGAFDYLIGMATLANAAAPAFSASTSLQALRETRATLVGELEAMLKKAEDENRDFTDDEQKAYDEKKGALNALDKRIDRMDHLAGAQAQQSAVRPAAARGNGIHHPPGPDAKREFESLGEFMYSVRFRPNDQRLAGLFDENVGQNAADLSAANELRMDTGSTGGFMIPPQFRGDLFQKIPPRDALVRPRATVIPAGDPPDAPITFPALDQSGAAPGNSFGGFQFQWIAEGALKPQSDIALTDVTLEPHEAAGHVIITDKLLRNWQAADGFVRGLMRDAKIAAEDYAFLRGNGVGKPLGIINAGATIAVHRTTSNLVKYIDLVNMVARLLMRPGVQPVWSMAQSVLPQIATLQDPLGNYIWKPIGSDDLNAAEGFAGTLLGYPVRWNNRAPALGTLGDVTLADWSYYLIKDGSGPFVAASEHVYFLNNKTVIKMFWNVDGAPWMQAPFVEENGYSVSPFVALDVP